MRHFITFALAALMASTAVTTVHGLPAINSVMNHPNSHVVGLNELQLNQCVTQILGGSKICDLSKVEGLISSLVKTVDTILSLDGHNCNLNTLSKLVNKAVSQLIKEGKAKKDGSDVQVTQVVVIVRALLVKLPAGSSKVKRDLLGNVTEILGDQGLSLDDVRDQVQDVLEGLNLPDVDLTNLPLHAEKPVCKLIEDLDLDCDDVLGLLHQD